MSASDAQAAEASDEASDPFLNRFLFVDIASMRAKQLKRGALPRLGGSSPQPDEEPETVDPPSMAGSTDADDPLPDETYEPEHAGEPAAPESMTVRPPRAEGSHRKLERVAMEEVRAGLIGYKLPEVEGRERGARDRR